MRDVPFAHVTIARPAQISGLDAVRANAADQRRADEKIVLVEVTAWPVVVEMEAELCRIAMPVGVLPEEVGDEDGLIAEVRRVQLAVGVLLQHVEVGDVVLITIVSIITKQARAEIDVAEDEAAKIRDERLNADAHRGRMEIGIVLVFRSAALKERNE